MIPKIIHYCWFGGNPLPPLAQKCIKSWKKYCPDYEIVRWDETNFDVNCNRYCQAMYEQKKWAFLTDYVRLKVVYERGGIYLDTDVELVKSLDKLLANTAYMGMETTQLVNTGLGFGAVKEHDFIRENKLHYERLDDFSILETCPRITTRLLEKYGLDCKSDEIQSAADVTVYPIEYFCAKDYKTGLLRVTKKTCSIHHFDGSWNTKEEQERTKARWKENKIERIKKAPKLLLRKLIGDERVDAIKRLLRRI